MIFSDIFIRWFFFLINPFIAMLVSFKEYTEPYAKNIFWAFCAFYGLTFAIGKESSNNDITRYVEELQKLHLEYNWGFKEIIQYFQNSGEIDVLRTIISFVLSRFTDNQGMLTMVYALIFGFFFSRNIWYVLNLLDGKISFLTKILILGLILVMPIWMINGFRMWTAFHIFIYGLLPFIFEKRKNKIIFIFLSILVHFSYIIPVAIFLFYLLVGNRKNIFFTFFIISISISEIDIGFVNQNVERFLPTILIERTASYRNEDVIESRKEILAESNMAWYVRWKGLTIKWTLYFIIFYFFLFAKREIRELPYWDALFAINLLYFSIANFLSNIPSGGRFLNFSIFLTFVMMIVYLNQCKKDLKYKGIIIVLSPIFLLYIIVSIRVGFYSMSLTTLLGNPLIAMFNMGETTSLNDLIK